MEVGQTMGCGKSRSFYCNKSFYFPHNPWSNVTVNRTNFGLSCWFKIEISWPQNLLTHKEIKI